MPGDVVFLRYCAPRPVPVGLCAVIARLKGEAGYFMAVNAETVNFHTITLSILPAKGRLAGFETCDDRCDTKLSLSCLPHNGQTLKSKLPLYLIPHPAQVFI
jgi:hypothetical protein